MAAFFNQYNLIFVVGKHATYVKNVATTVQRTFKTNAVVVPFTPHFPMNAIIRLHIPVILYHHRYMFDASLLQHVRENNGLIIWTHKSRFISAHDLFVVHSQV